ncbi:MAG: hypothetical protein AAGD25_06760 [Cyanobacteria bacterium P01_F01_bin.150]
MSFTIPTGIGFAASLSTGYGSPLNIVVGPAEGGGVGTAYQELENPDTEEQGIVSVPTYSEEISVTLPVTAEGFTIEGISRLSIGGAIYALDALGAGHPGHFTFDAATQVLTIYPGTSSPPQPGESIRYTALLKGKSVTYSNVYRGEIPQLWKTLNLNGVVTLSHSLGQSPTGSMNFDMVEADFDPCDLEEGTTFEFRGEAYGVATVSSSRNPHNTDGLATFTVGLQGPHDHLLDEQVLYRGAIANVPGSASSGIRLSSSNSNEGATRIAFSNLCARAGFNFIGPDVVIRIDAGRSDRDATVLSSELNRARAAKAFAFLSNPDGLEFREWNNTAVHHLSSSEILNGDDNGTSTPYTIAYNLSGAEWNGCKLAEEYKNRELTFEEEGQDNENGRVNNVVVLLSGSALSESGGTVVYTPPANVDRSMPTANFDQGGPVETFRREVIQNGRTLSVEETHFGYSYKCSDFVEFRTFTAGSTTNVRTVFPAPELQDRLQGWGEVYHSFEDYEYNPDGYLIRIVKRITTQRRFKQETAERESLRLHSLANFATSNDPTRQALLRQSYADSLTLYDSFQVTEVDVTDFEIESMEPYYPNLPTRADGDPIPKYVRKQTRSHKSIYSKSALDSIVVDDDGNATIAAQSFNQPNTDFSVDVEGLNVSTGIDYTEEIETVIVYPFIGIPEARYRSEDDQYKVITNRRTAQGENLKNVLDTGTVTETLSGKPSLAERLEIYQETGTPTLDTDDEDDSQTILLNTPNSGRDPSSDPIDGTLSFPSTFSRAEALAAAEIDASIANTRAVKVRSGVLVAPNRYYQVGDVIIYEGERHRVLSVDIRPEIVGDGQVRLGPIELTWGKEIDLRGEVSLDAVDVD